MALSNVCRDNLLLIADTYAKATGLPLDKVSKRFYGQNNFLSGFKKGNQSITLRKFDELVDKFRKDWPADTPWPHLRAVIIERPKAVNSHGQVSAA
jgi:hypothetical protein